MRLSQPNSAAASVILVIRQSLLVLLQQPAFVLQIVCPRPHGTYPDELCLPGQAIDRMAVWSMSFRLPNLSIPFIAPAQQKEGYFGGRSREIGPNLQ